MIRTPAATSLQLARAEALGKALTHHGWTGRREPQDKHPGAIGATAHARSGVRTLILTLGGHRGQMIEITAEATTGYRGAAGRRVREVKPSWRLTAYDAPTDAILAAATAALDKRPGPNPLEYVGWTVEHALTRNVDGSAPPYPADAATPKRTKVRATRFIRPDGSLIATFHVPTYTPPCERCSHHGELGDTGGWNIIGPGFTVEATAHTPGPVIGAFTRALPGNGPGQAAATPNSPTVRPRQRAKNIPAEATMPGALLTVAVC
ncbi:hypothetical protein [Catenulispora pinisilvae]|uniref:hypothetical protein n=1 Tax=Catenulispora pinisilvae TaxID=2705253 RepID=UPI0018922909|nr:hypothetical protein [Catenulispora pinisilvae]